MSFCQTEKRKKVYAAHKSPKAAASHLLLSILFTLVTIAYMPQLT